MKVALLIATLLAGSALAVPIFAEDKAVPDFSGVWARTAIFGFEMPPSGAGPLRNLQRRRDGTSDASVPVGDYKSSVLKPEAAEIVRKKGLISLAGLDYPDPSNQCRPMSTPYIMRVQEIELLQQKHQVTILYMQDHHVRRVRLNGAHPARPTPTWNGDSVGHYEGDTLVVDTIALKTGPVAVIDAYGTPHSDALHVVERYRLIDREAAEAATARSGREYGQPAAAPTGDGLFADFEYKGKALQVEFTVEDEKVFTTPWTGLVTLWHATNDWEEHVCAENLKEYYDGTDTEAPQAAKPDF
jgi:hypothetical protein